MQVVHWPPVLPTDRCGAGFVSGNTENKRIIPCLDCVHWHQPGGEPVKPGSRWGRPPEWWAETGYCTRNAPAPGADQKRGTHWKVTHAAEGCGDGEALPAGEEDEVEGERPEPPIYEPPPELEEVGEMLPAHRFPEQPE